MVLSPLDIHGLNDSRTTYVILAQRPSDCVAQLVERRICIQEVLGLIPSLGSHLTSSQSIPVLFSGM